MEDPKEAVIEQAKNAVNNLTAAIMNCETLQDKTRDAYKDALARWRIILACLTMDVDKLVEDTQLELVSLKSEIHAMLAKQNQMRDELEFKTELISLRDEQLENFKKMNTLLQEKLHDKNRTESLGDTEGPQEE